MEAKAISASPPPPYPPLTTPRSRVQSAFLVNIALLGDGDGCNLMWKFPQKQIEIFAPVDLLKAKDTLTELVVVPSTLK